MICPYAVNRTVVVQTKYGYNDENIQTSAVIIGGKYEKGIYQSANERQKRNRHHQ